MPKQPKMTPWFPPEVKPVHVGIYPVRTFGVGYSLWDGRQRGCEQKTIKNAMAYPMFSYAMQAKPWRGLAEKP